MDEIRKKFCKKIHFELMQYKKRLLRRPKHEILERAYEADNILAIYEELAELSGYMNEDVLLEALHTKNLLYVCYTRWLNTKDSAEVERSQCVVETITKKIA